MNKDQRETLWDLGTDIHLKALELAKQAAKIGAHHTVEMANSLCAIVGRRSRILERDTSTMMAAARNAYYEKGDAA